MGNVNVKRLSPTRSPAKVEKVNASKQLKEKTDPRALACAVRYNQFAICTVLQKLFCDKVLELTYLLYSFPEFRLSASTSLGVFPHLFICSRSLLGNVRKITVRNQASRHELVPFSCGLHYVDE